MTSWSVVAERAVRETVSGKITFKTIVKWSAADTKYDTYEEADKERMKLTNRFPKYDFFVKQEELV
jgi:hypothetical protein